MNFQPTFVVDEDPARGRAIAIVIAAPHLPEDKRFATPVVVEMLRRMADGIERDEARPWADKDCPPAEGWQQRDGQMTFDLHDDPDYREVTVVWHVEDAADDAMAVDANAIVQPADLTPQYHAATAEKLADLTEAERDAMRWTVKRDFLAWHFNAPDDSTRLSFENDGQTLDDACALAVKLLRERGYIGENEKLSFKLGELR